MYEKYLLDVNNFNRVGNRMKMKIIKKMDVVIIVVLLIISFIPYGMLKSYQSVYEGKVYAVISIAGEEKKRIELKQGTDEEFIFSSQYGFNKVIVQDSKIGIVEADCRDGICIKEGLKGNVGERIVCLPNKLIIEILGEQKSNTKEDVISR